MTTHWPACLIDGMRKQGKPTRPLTGRKEKKVKAETQKEQRQATQEAKTRTSGTAKKALEKHNQPKGRQNKATPRKSSE